MEEKQFTVGFARCDITPQENNIPLSGYGAVDLRRSTVVQDRLYAQILCLGEGDEPKLMLVTCDLISAGTITDGVRAAVSKTTGIPEGQVLVGGTHTHSGPAAYSKAEEMIRYLAYLYETIGEAAKAAASDLRPAKIFYSTVEVGHPGCRMNFCRHYKIARVELRDTMAQEDFEYCGSNFNDIHSSDKEHYRLVDHAQNVDPMLREIRLVREDADDIVLVNFQAHATITGGGKKTIISSDYPGALRDRVEEILPGTKCIYYNGAAGNVNPCTRLDADGLPGITFGGFIDHRAYAAVLAAYVLRADRHLVESKTSKLDFRKEVVTLKHDHSKDGRLEEAQIVSKRFAEIGAGQKEIRELCDKYGFNSAYQCNAIIAKAKRPETGDVEINAVRIGDCAMALSLGEYFNDLGEYIKKGSPFKQTFLKCYSSGDGCYFPSIGSPENSYERNTTRFAPGSGEQLCEHFIHMLYDMYDE